VHDTVNKRILLHLTAGPKWGVDSSGTWTLGSNWVGGAAPTVVANFLDGITAPRTISLNGDRTVHNLNFDNDSSYTIAPGSGTPTPRLLIADASHVGNIDVDSGNHLIAAPIVFSGGAGIDIAAGASLTLSGGVTIPSGKTVTKTGPGTLTIGGPQTNSGRLELAKRRLEFKLRPRRQSLPRPHRRRLDPQALRRSVAP
jgi:hypothetical protein